MTKLRLLIFLFLLCALPMSAEPLKVGVAGSAPFVVQSESLVDGISIQIWEAAAELNKYDYEYVVYPSVKDALNALKDDELDLAIGPISITSARAEYVDFTQPYFSSDLGILTHPVKKGWFDHAKTFLKSTFLYGLFFLLAILAVVGGLVWIAERKQNSEEFPNDASGLAQGMWFAIVTMTTVGYGDKSPRSLPGRVVTGIWMLVATISYSTLTAGIATTLTLQSLDSAAIVNPEDMRDERVAVVAGTTGASAARQFGATVIGCNDLEEATKYLTDGDVEAVVFDVPALQYHIQKNPKEYYLLSKTTFDTQVYGFALPVESKYLHELNVALLTLHEEELIEDISERWMSSQE